MLRTLRRYAAGAFRGSEDKVLSVRPSFRLENGRLVLDGDAETLRDNADVREFYLGLTEIGKKSYRDVKHYHRRKRWLA